MHDLTSQDEVIKFIESLNASGGGDFPEAVMDGLYEAATKISWRQSFTTPTLRYDSLI